MSFSMSWHTPRNFAVSSCCALTALRLMLTLLVRRPSPFRAPAFSAASKAWRTFLSTCIDSARTLLRSCPATRRSASTSQPRTRSCCTSNTDCRCSPRRLCSCSTPPRSPSRRSTAPGAWCLSGGPPLGVRRYANNRRNPKAILGAAVNFQPPTDGYSALTRHSRS